MLKKIIISFLITTFLITVPIFFSFVYFEHAQQFIIKALNLKQALNKKLEIYISNKLNDKSLQIDIGEIDFLEPEWPNLLRVELGDININTENQAESSNIKFIELGFSYYDLVTNIFSQNHGLAFSYFNFNHLTLNGNLEKKKFIPGPLIQILTSVNKNYTKNKNIKKIWENEISIGNINFLLLDKRNETIERKFIINCTNVFISKNVKKLRSIIMNCKDNNKAEFSVNAKIDEKYNRFSGNMKNINPKHFKDGLLDLDEGNFTKNLNTNLNGGFNFITDKNFKLKSLNFFSKKSIISFNDSNNNKFNFKRKFNGTLSWNENENFLHFKNVVFEKKIIGSGTLDLTSRKGSVELKLEKLILKSVKKNITNHKNYIKRFINLSKIENYLSYANAGSFNKAIINLNFSFIKRLKFIDISGSSKFVNMIVKHENSFLNKISSTISGNFKFQSFFKNNRIVDQYSWIEMNIDASKGTFDFKEPYLNYKFDQASLKLKMNTDYLKISKATFTRKNQVDFSFKDIIIENEILKNGYFTVHNNYFFSNILKKEFNIDLVGATEFNFSLQGNLKDLDFKLNFYSDLLGVSLNSNVLNIRKNKNTPGLVKAEIRFENGRLKFLKDFAIQTDKDLYTIQSIIFKENSFRKILLKNVRSKQFILNEVNISRINGYINLLIAGKKINLSSIKSNIKNKSVLEKKINFDITADKIIFDPKVVLSGNIQGTIEKSIFKSVAYGQMSFGESSLLESGKLNILINNKLSKLNGIGLTGGAETKIQLIKKKNDYPQLNFETTDGGKLLRALGFTPNIRSGEMKMEIKFLDALYNQYDVKIDSKNFSLINVPGFINSLSILSFSGIQSIVTGEGVFFNKGKAKIFVKDNIFNFDKLYLSSESLGISARGKLNLNYQSIDLRGSVAPIKLISKIISLVPAVGELITGLKKEGLFAGQFKMTGPLKKPKIKLNTLSFAPGILRNFFSEDWLDKNNFFVKNKAN
jgi:hypothetical protein